MRATGYTTGVWKPPNKNSIDATSDAVLDEVRAYFPYAPNHSHCDQGAKNILEGWAMYGRVGQLFGHGAPGLISAGCGRQVMSAGPGELISLSRSDWRASLSQLDGRSKALRLSGCSVGAGYEGLELLREVSCVVGAPVLAPTGPLFVSGGRIWVQPGTTWQIGECQFDGTPINMSRRSRPTQKSAPSALAQRFDDPSLEAHFERPQYAGGGSADWAGDGARELLALAGLLEEPVMHARALGIPTGTLIIQTSDGETRYELLGESVLELDAGRASFTVQQEFLDQLPPYRPEV